MRNILIKEINLIRNISWKYETHRTKTVKSTKAQNTTNIVSPNFAKWNRQLAFIIIKKIKLKIHLTQLRKMAKTTHFQHNHSPTYAKKIYTNLDDQSLATLTFD